MKIVPVAIAFLGLAGPAAAAFTEVNLSAVVNSNVAINPGTFPTGISMGNQGNAIPFAISAYPSSGTVAGTWNAAFAASFLGGQTLDLSLTSYGLTNQKSFYALLNNYFGTPGADEYDITVKATGGLSVTFQSIGGVDTRDYNSNIYTNAIAASTTAWFDNGIGQRLDERLFTLPTAFAAQTLTDFIVTQKQPGDTALFSGLTFSTAAASFQPPPTGAPAPAAAVAGGAMLLGLLRRRAR